MGIAQEKVNDFQFFGVSSVNYLDLDLEVYRSDDKSTPSFILQKYVLAPG